MNALFSLENVSVSYGKKQVVRQVDIQIEKGEFCGLLGLNGSGKTTLLHAACGFIPMSGRCSVDGLLCNQINERQRAKLISFIPQVSSLEGGKSVLEVVLMGYNAWLNIWETASGEQKKEALNALEMIGCAHLAEDDFGKISQGQKQMIILARSMVQNTPVMLMDEPDSALDFLNKHLVLDKIRHLIKKSQKAGLITLHDPNFAMEYCDRLFLLKNGGIEAEINMKTDNEESILRKLSVIYGEVCLMKAKSGYLMGKL